MIAMLAFHLLAISSSWYTVAAFTPHRVPSGVTLSIPFPTQLHVEKNSNLPQQQGPTLYGSQGSRSPLINWGALEIHVPMQMGNLSKNPHPFGQIPCLIDDNNVIVFESGAILQYLYSNSAIRLQDSHARQAAILSWIVWANASLDPICFLSNDGRVYDTGLRKPNRRIDTVNELLSKQEFLIAEGGFSLADVAVASYLLYVLQFFPDVDLTQWPHLVRYMKRCASREAYGKAFGARVQAFLISGLDAMINQEVEDDDLEDDGNGGDSGQIKKKIMGIF